MLLPYLSETQNASKKYSVAFRGINYGEGTQDGEFADTYNLSTAQYPCLSQMADRQMAIYFGTSLTGLHSKDKLITIDGTSVKYGGKTVNEGYPLTEGKKQIATIGNYVVIFPDKMYYKVPTKEEENNFGVNGYGEFGSMEIEYKLNEGEELKFTASTITTTGANFKFKEGDAVKIEGCKENGNNKEIIVRGVSEKVLTFADNSFTASTESGTVTLKREVPDLDFICESNYRLWGTHGNTIYSSKFSDPFNFNVFDGLVDDSYAIEVGSEGEFTGCIPFSSHICFFKENTLHKLYGTKPSNFQINTVNVYGVQSGSEKSMQIVNEQLLYKGVNGVYSYTGGVPELISEKFGNRRYSDAVACCDGETYYISMKQGENWHLFTYDVLRNIWLRIGDTQMVDATIYDGNVYFIDGKQPNRLFFYDNTEKYTQKYNNEWGATFCTFHETMNEKKGYSKFHLRMDMGENSWLAVDIKTDNDTKWREVYTTHNEKAKTVSIPIIPTRCDSIDIRLRGKGKCTIKTFIREFTVGSDV